MTSSSRRLTPLLTGAAVLAALASAEPRTAWGFECTSVPDVDISQSWQTRCIPFAISCKNDLLTAPDIEATIERSFAAWQTPDCSDMSFVRVGYSPEDEGFDAAVPEAQYNTISAIENDDETLFPEPRLLALTFTHYVVATGEILDADIVLNSARFEFADVEALNSCNRDSDVFDLENTLVHEIGHFIGFDHETNVPESTMFPEAEACEIKKRTLDQDDIDGLCQVYPAGGPLSPCSPPPSYDTSALDGRPFRQQCQRFAAGDQAIMTFAECQMFIEDNAGGCSCRAEHGEAPGWTDGLFLAAALLLLATRRR